MQRREKQQLQNSAAGREYNREENRKEDRSNEKYNTKLKHEETKGE